MKYAVSSYSFHTLTDSGEYSEKELISLAKDIGFDGIEFAEIHPQNEKKKASYASLLREESEKRGLPIINYAVGANFLKDENDGGKAEVERLFSEIDIAEIMGCRLMRHDIAYGYEKSDKRQLGFENALPLFIKCCNEASDYAAAKGIKTMSENHGTFCQESLRMEKIVTGVHNPNYGILLDMGNFLCADDDPAKAFGRLVPYCFHVHAKDFHIKSGDSLPPQDGFFCTRGGNYLRGAIIGHGEVPVFQCLKILKDYGYDGYITVEFEGLEDPKLGVKYGLNTLKYMQKLLEL